MILHIETATKICSVALSKNGVLVGLMQDDNSAYTHAESLTVFIQQLLHKHAVQWQEIKAIAVTSGPGSYTGLRIGVSTAKGLCYGLEIPLIAVNALQSIAAQMRDQHPEKTYIPMIDARRMEVFSAVYDNHLNEIRPIQADIIDEHSYSNYTDKLVAGDGALKLKEIWKNRNDITWLPAIQSSAKGQIAIATEKYQRQKFEDVAYFEPFYLKDFK